MRCIIVCIFFLFVGTRITAQENICNSEGTSSTANSNAQPLYKQGLRYYFTNNDSAIYYMNKALGLYAKNGDLKGEMACLSRLSKLYSFAGELDTAFVLAYQAIDIGEENHFDTLLAETYLRIGNIYSRIKKYESAKEFYFKTIAIGLPNTMNGAVGALGQIYMKQEKLDSAHFFLNKSLLYFKAKDCTLSETAHNISSIYGSLGIIAFKQQRYRDGITYFNNSLRLAKRLNDDFNVISSHINLSIAYDILQKPKLAEKSLEDALYLADSMNYEQYKLNVYNVLVEHYVEWEQFKDAYIWTVRYHALQDSLDRADYEKVIYENELKYYTRIQKEKQRRIVAEEKQKRLYLTVIIIGSSLLFLLITFLLYRRLKLVLQERKKFEEHAKSMENNLEEAEYKLTKLNAHLVEQNKLLNALQKRVELDDPLKSNDLIKELDSIKIIRKEDWEQYLDIFQQLYPKFLVKMNQKAEKLSEGDKRQLIMIKLNYSRKKAASILGISEVGVKRGRQRLAKKLRLKDITQLDDFIKEN